MIHKPAPKSRKDYASAFKTRIGVWMFFVYAAIYAGFVAINLIRPVSMEQTVFLGLNLAIVYGFGLIIVALLMALIYNHFCTARETKMRLLDTDREDK